MNFRKNSILIIGGGVALVLLAVTLFFLISSIGKYQTNQESYRSAMNRLNSLNSRAPYPSSDNVAIAQANLDTLKDRFGSLQNGLTSAQIAAQQIEPAQFAPMLEETSRRIRSRAAEASLVLPTEPGLGFKDYAAGRLPPNNPRIMERLVVQIRGLEDIINVALEARLSSIDSIQRDEFESRADAEEEAAAPARGRGRQAARGGPVAPVRAMLGGVPMPEPSTQYNVERYVISVTGREVAIWDFLNRLMSRPIVYSIADISFENPRTDLGRAVDLRAKLGAMNAAARQAAQPVPGAPMTAGRPQVAELTMTDITREDRVVGGRELIRVRAVVDMYRFNQLEGEGQ